MAKHLWSRNRDILHSLLSLFIILVGCRTSPPDPLQHPYNNDYLAASKRIEANSAADEIGRFLNNISRMTISSGDLTNVFRVATLNSSEIAVLDGGTMLVHRVKTDGTDVAILGGHGREPGHYISPSDLITIPTGVAVVDFTTHRVIRYDTAGKFAGSFIYTPQGFSGSRILYDQHANTFALFGNRWKSVYVSGQPTSDLVHLYKNDGTFVKSAFEFPSRLMPLGLINDDAPVTSSDEAGNMYFMLPFEYTIHVISPSGSVSDLLSSSVHTFHAPTTPLHLEDRDLAKFHSWELQWTPIRALVIDHGVALVEYEAFDRLRYTVDVWRLSDHTKLATYETNCLIVSHPNEERRIMLVNNPMFGGTRPYELIFGTISPQ